MDEKKTGIEQKWKIGMFDISELEKTEINANQMSKVEYDRLVENIKKSGGLSSAIGCYKRHSDGKLVIFSGNHRYKAAIQLRIKKVPVVWCNEDELEEDEKVALQLSHNSLHGKDDNNILKKLFDTIQSVDWKAAAYINVDQFQTLDVSGISFEPESESYSMYVLLYRNDMKNMQELLGILDEDLKSADLVVVADGDKNEDTMLKLTKEIRHNYQLRSAHMGFSKLLELARLGMQVDLERKGSEDM